MRRDVSVNVYQPKRAVRTVKAGVAGQVDQQVLVAGEVDVGRADPLRPRDEPAERAIRALPADP